jgi:anthranilate phosphoribosyltransferase
VKEEEDMIEQLVMKAVNREDLNAVEMGIAMEEILSGRAAPGVSGAFLTAMRMKGETAEEVTAAARAMRRHTRRIDAGEGVVSIDREEINTDAETIRETSGAGGTRIFNVSTATAFVAAGAGLRVARHGSRSASGACGSADVLERLGVNLDVPPTAAQTCIREIGIGFLYEPLFNAGLAAAAGVGRQLGFRTLLNRLGPLANPAGADVQVLGVYAPAQVELMAQVLKALGMRKALVVCGERTFDEISICGKTLVARLAGEAVSVFELTPEDCGLERAAPESIRGGDARQNAGIVRRVLEGEAGPCRDIVLLNAAAVFVAAGADHDLRAGAGRAAESVDSGRALAKLDAFVDFSGSCLQAVRA